LLPVFVVWLVVVMVTGFVGLATMISVASFAGYIAITEAAPSVALLTFGGVMTLFVCYTHRSNIERMLAGTESRAKRLWLLRPR
jgi:glycerol-3-phosphate acyltransferase PlsY